MGKVFRPDRVRRRGDAFWTCDGATQLPLFFRARNASAADLRSNFGPRTAWQKTRDQLGVLLSRCRRGPRGDKPPDRHATGAAISKVAGRFSWRHANRLSSLSGRKKSSGTAGAYVVAWRRLATRLRATRGAQLRRTS